MQLALFRLTSKMQVAPFLQRRRSISEHTEEVVVTKGVVVVSNGVFVVDTSAAVDSTRAFDIVTCIVVVSGTCVDIVVVGAST